MSCYNQCCRFGLFRSLTESAARRTTNKWAYCCTSDFATPQASGPINSAGRLARQERIFQIGLISLSELFRRSEKNRVRKAVQIGQKSPDFRKGSNIVRRCSLVQGLVVIKQRLQVPFFTRDGNTNIKISVCSMSCTRFLMNQKSSKIKT